MSRQEEAEGQYLSKVLRERDAAVARAERAEADADRLAAAILDDPDSTPRCREALEAHDVAVAERAVR